MDQSIKHLVLACFLASLTGVSASGGERCGHFNQNADKCDSDCSSLLEGEFKSLLNAAANGEATPVEPQVTQPCQQKAQCASRTVAQIPVVSSYVPAPEETPAGTHLLPRTHLEPAPVTKTCVLKDQDTDERLLTLKIPAAVRAETISKEELEARQSQEIESSSYEVAKKRIQPNTQLGATPRIRIGQNEETGAVQVEAHNADVLELLDAISIETGVAIMANPRLEGTISSTTEAESLIVLVRTMLEPFNYSIVPTADALIVCGPNESPTSVKDSLLAWQQQQFEQADYEEPIAAAPVANPPAAPPVAAQVTTPAQATTPVTQPVPQPSLPIPAVNVEPVVATRPAQAIKLASAETAPKVSLPPSRISSLPKPQPTAEEIAVERIVRVAQDAFATDQREYAMQVLAQGIKRFPRATAPMTMLAEMHYLRGDYQRAAQQLERSLSLDKNDAMANELMGRSLAALGNKTRAKHYLLQAQDCRRASR